MTNSPLSDTMCSARGVESGASPGFSQGTYSKYLLGLRPTYEALLSSNVCNVGAGAKVLTATELGEIAFRHGQIKKRNNAIVALISGALPGVLLTFYFPSNWQRWFVGMIIGLLWGNAFEYAYHRWLLHRPRSSLGKGHLEHHANIGLPPHAIARLGLTRTFQMVKPFGKVLVTVAVGFPGGPGKTMLTVCGPGVAPAGIVMLLVDFLLSLRITAGIFIGWTVYLITAEEIHWRIHMKGWLPPGIRFARAYHMAHHDIPNIRYNVFLPLFDLLFGNTAIRTRKQVIV